MDISHEDLVTALGTPFTNKAVNRLRSVAHIPRTILENISQEALHENWGNDLYVLEKYLAVHFAWSIEQERYTRSDNQLFAAAGHLQTRYGTPLFLVFEKNNNPDQQPLYCVHSGSDISAPELPRSPDIPEPPEIPRGVEIVMLHEHILRDNSNRVPFLDQTPPVSQMCAVSGAIQWALNRRLELPYWYFGRMNYLVPLYMQDRENITQAPDLIAPIQVNSDSLIVRTVLLPQMPYANARVSVRRHDELPHWMLDGWNASAAQLSENEIDDPEPATTSG